MLTVELQRDRDYQWEKKDEKLKGNMLGLISRLIEIRFLSSFFNREGNGHIYQQLFSAGVAGTKSLSTMDYVSVTHKILIDLIVLCKRIEINMDSFKHCARERAGLTYFNCLLADTFYF